jgi:hypothetical protein
MTHEIIIEDVDIDVVQKITKIKINNPHSINRTDDGVSWGGHVQLLNGDSPLGNRKVRNAIQKNTTMTFVELNVVAQAVLGKDYIDLNVAEVQQVHGQTMATKLITAINEADAGIAIADVTALVVAIVTALA